ncbi:MAG TPA: uracil phosphoribosyltransferase [Spirochaetia bacterium]|nr:uracil phosphoribosyltransferase [Spirochaetia bacterium]
MANVILKAQDLDGFLSGSDKKIIEDMNGRYGKALERFAVLTDPARARDRDRATEELIGLYNEMGHEMREIVAKEPRIHVYSFETPREVHGEVSRLIAKLRDARTEHPEFLYYTQRAYELLFNFAIGSPADKKKNHIVVKTAVTLPIQNYAVHKIPDVDDRIENSVMCVMLRGALLPAMIMSKEIQEYSSHGYVTPFALFKISRDDTKEEHNMEYVLNLDRSYFDPASLDGKDLFFADPMNATGGSLVTVVKYLLDKGVKPRSIKFFNVISVLKGALRIVRALKEAEIYTLWMDPVLNSKAYILPGLGDAGDRINGHDDEEKPRNIIQLIADYGTAIVSLYREQVRKIEQTVLGG